MRRCVVILALLLAQTWASAQIPLSDVTVLGSPARVLNFPAVGATLEHVGLTPGALNLVVRHATPWPAVSIDGGEPSQAGTLWVFLRIGGKWYATGAERLRPQQLDGVDKPQELDVNTWIGTTWLYDPSRWGPMAGYVPQAGELVGFMVAAGSSRSDDQAPVEQRTKVIEFAWPGAGGTNAVVPVWVEGEEPPPPPPPPLVDLGPILLKLSAISLQLSAIESRLMAVEARKVPMSCAASANLGFARIPVSCRLD